MNKTLITTIAAFGLTLAASAAALVVAGAAHAQPDHRGCRPV